MNPTEHTGKIVDHLFRHQAGKMIAVLTRIFGTHNLQLAEDVVQEAFLKAAQLWTYNGVPENGAAWLMQVARNKALDILRRQQNFQQYSKELSARSEADTEHAVEQFFLESEIEDSQLRMIFACCHPSLDAEDQIALTLKTVSGFGTAEIARALVTNEAVIQKRLYRARQFLRNNNIQLEIPSGPELDRRLDTVYTILYLVFNEGYNSLKADELIRKDLCAEAMRLCLLLNNHKRTSQPAGAALLSLMCFHAARFESRLDETDSIILLGRQDRSKWNRELIMRGYQYLNQSSQGNQLTVYHIESAIAGEHCLTPTFEQTNWMRVLQLYDLLLERNPSPIVHLNRAVVLSQLGYHADAIREVLQIPSIDKLLSTQHIYPSVLAELYLQSGDHQQARHYLQSALSLTSSRAEQRLLREKLGDVNGEVNGEW
jgi:RNA polymerase sigma factor (sigma-70 family)